VVQKDIEGSLKVTAKKAKKKLKILAKHLNPTAVGYKDYM